MKKIRLTPLLFRRIHKWVGLILSLQFLLWALSGSVMALLDKDRVGGHGGGACLRSTTRHRRPDQQGKKHRFENLGHCDGPPMSLSSGAAIAIANASQ